MKPVMSVCYSELYRHDDWAWQIKTMQPRGVMWLVGGEPPEKSPVRASYNLCPNSWIVLRLMDFEPAFTQDMLSDPLGVAKLWLKCIEATLPKIGDLNRTIICGPFNEFGFRNENLHLDGFVEMERNLCRLTMQTFGIRSMIGNFSVGMPDPDLIPLYRPALVAAKAYGAVLGLHQYMQLLATDEAMWTSHRDQLWEEYLSDPLCNIPIMVTETNIEQNFDRPDQRDVLMRLTGGRKTPGWQTSEEAFRFRGFTKPLGELFVDQLRTLAHMYTKTTRIKASYVFMNTREPGWFGYDPQPVMPALVEWIGSESITGLTSLDPDKWLDEPLVQPPPDLLPVDGLYRVEANALNVRSSPSADTDANKLHVVRRGDLVDVEDIQGDWARTTAYVHRNYIRRVPE